MATTSPQATDTRETKRATSPTDSNASAVLMTATPTLGGEMLAELQTISETLSKTSKPIGTQDIWNFLLQFFGVLAAITFGVFSVLAWVDANKANSIASGNLNLAIEANTLALLAYCLSSNDTSTTGICATVQSKAAPVLTSVLASLPTSVTGGNGSGNGSGNANNTGPNIVGLISNPSRSKIWLAAPILGGVTGIFVLSGMLLLPLQTYKEKIRRNRVVEEQSSIRRAWARPGQGYRSSPVRDWASPAQSPRPDREPV